MSVNTELCLAFRADQLAGKVHPEQEPGVVPEEENGDVQADSYSADPAYHLVHTPEAGVTVEHYVEILLDPHDVQVEHGGGTQIGPPPVDAALLHC